MIFFIFSLSCPKLYLQLISDSDRRETREEKEARREKEREERRKRVSQDGGKKAP